MFLSFPTIKKDNIELRKRLGIEDGRAVNLKIRSGFFICPRDEMNRTAPLAPISIPLPFTIVKMLEKINPQIYSNIMMGFGRIFPSTGLPEDNYIKFKEEAAIVYLLAAASYVNEKKPTFKSIGKLFNNPHKEIILKNFNHYVRSFIDKHGYTHSLAAFYENAIKDLGKPMPFDEFVQGALKGKYSVIGHLIGGALEKSLMKDYKLEEARQGLTEVHSRYDDVSLEEVKEDVVKIVREYKDHYAGLVSGMLKQPGVLLALDADTTIQKMMSSKKLKGLHKPDFMFVTKDFIVPVDSKANLLAAKQSQVGAENFRALFNDLPSVFHTIFDQVTVEGKFIEKTEAFAAEIAKAEGQAVKQNKKEGKPGPATPMQVLAKMKALEDKKDFGVIAMLWGQGKPISQEILESHGVKGNLGKIAGIFNGMLKKK